MPRKIAMSVIVTRCQQRADKVGDDFILAAEWKSMISEVYGTDVHSVVAETGGRYWDTLVSLTTTGAATLSEPADHLSTVWLTYVASATDRRRLIRVMPGEEASVAEMTGTEPVYYALLDDVIKLYPTPASGLVVELQYVPQAPDISALADAGLVDVVTPDGEACLYWGVAVLARIKASQDVSFHVQKAELHRTRLMAWAAERSIGDANRRVVTDDGAGFADAGDWRR